LAEEGMKALMDNKLICNIRELKKIIRQAAISCEQELIGANELSTEHYDHLVAIHPYRPCKSCTAYDMKKVLKSIGCNATLTMKLLGISRTAFYQKLRNYKIAISSNVG